MAEKKLVTKLKEEIRRRNYSYKTEKAYTQWIVRDIKRGIGGNILPKALAVKYTNVSGIPWA